MKPRVCAIGIDVGTSAVRVVAISDRADIVGNAYAALGHPPEAGESLVQHPSTWWRATTAALFTIGKRVDLRQIRALSIDATSGTVLGVDERGFPQTRGRMYNDRALPATVEALAKVLPENSAARGSTSPLARMVEMQQPQLYKLLHQADWLTGQFSGRFDVSDESNALKSGFDVVARAWPAWIGDTGLDPQLLPRVVPTGTDLGHVRPEVAEQFGFQSDLRIVSGTTDGCASFIASGAHDVGDAVTSLGSTLTLKQVCTTPIAVARFGIYSHRWGDRWICGGASNSGGAALLKFFSREQLAEIEPRLKPDEPTNLGYYPLPGIGERFPYSNPALQPRMEPRPVDDARFLQGLLEGIAAIEKIGYSRLQECGAPAVKRVVTIGGGSHNEPWRKIRQRLMGVPVSRGFAEAAYGAALIALSALN